MLVGVELWWWNYSVCCKTSLSPPPPPQFHYSSWKISSFLLNCGSGRGEIVVVVVEDL